MNLPDGWIEEERSDDSVALGNPSTGQRTTVSVLTLAAKPSFEEFKYLCEHRLGAEMAAGTTVFVEAGEPFAGDDKFQMLYSGGEKATGRFFSGYLSSSEAKLTTLYVEGVGISPKAHLDTFAWFVRNVRW